MRCIVQLPVATIFALAAATATSAQEKKDKPAKFVADLGLVNVSGSTDITTFNLAEMFSYKAGNWSLGQDAGSVVGSSKGKTTANQYHVGLRADDALSARVSLYGLAGWDRNTFANIGYRFQEGTGLSWKAIAGKTDELALASGISAIQQQSFNPDTSTGLRVDQKYPAGRAAGAYKHMLGAKSFFQQTAEFLEDLKDTSGWILNTESSLVAPFSASVALKVGYIVRHDNHAAFKNTDRVFNTAIQITY